MYLKNNNTPTNIPSINARAIVAGNMQTGVLFNFAKDSTTNSLKYTGPGARFHVIATFNFFSSSQKTCGFYIGHNTNPTQGLSADADRISESEVYINSASSSAQPVGGVIQTILDLNTNDRVFFIVQNKDSDDDITIEFLKFTVTSITAERGATGVAGSVGDYVISINGQTGAVEYISDFKRGWFFG
jgi:hypothetical protein